MKKILRNKLRAERLKIVAPERLSAALAAAKLLTANTLFQASEHIACYFATQSEFETTPLIKAIWQAGKSCYLPVLTQQKALVFVKYQENDPLVLNEYHILEPKPGLPSLPLDQLNLVILPLLGFDLQGHRLGAGGGYYDRTFAYKHDFPAKKPFLLGLGYQAQQVEAFPNEAWDVKLDGILTERNLQVF